MSYSTRYGISRYDVKRKPSFKGYISLLVILAALISFQFLAPTVFEDISSAFFPLLNKNVIRLIFDTVNCIHKGAPSVDAVAAFCREILYENVH